MYIYIYAYIYYSRIYMCIYLHTHEYHLEFDSGTLPLPALYIHVHIYIYAHTYMYAHIYYFIDWDTACEHDTQSCQTCKYMLRIQKVYAHIFRVLKSTWTVTCQQCMCRCIKICVYTNINIFIYKSINIYRCNFCQPYIYRRACIYIFTPVDPPDPIND